jgi:hypothetical protein
VAAEELGDTAAEEASNGGGGAHSRIDMGTGLAGWRTRKKVLASRHLVPVGMSEPF